MTAPVPAGSVVDDGAIPTGDGPGPLTARNPNNPRGSAISADGQFLYVPNYDDASVSVIKIA